MIDLPQKYLKVKIGLVCDVSEDILMVKVWQTRQFSGVLLNTKENSSTLLYVYEHLRVSNKRWAIHTDTTL